MDVSLNISIIWVIYEENSKFTRICSANHLRKHIEATILILRQAAFKIFVGSFSIRENFSNILIKFYAENKFKGCSLITKAF